MSRWISLTEIDLETNLEMLKSGPREKHTKQRLICFDGKADFEISVYEGETKKRRIPMGACSKFLLRHRCKKKRKVSFLISRQRGGGLDLDEDGRIEPYVDFTPFYRLIGDQI